MIWVPVSRNHHQVYHRHCCDGFTNQNSLIAYKNEAKDGSTTSNINGYNNTPHQTKCPQYMLKPVVDAQLALSPLKRMAMKWGNTHSYVGIAMLPIGNQPSFTG
jgi:hypothetical protein